MSAPRRDADGRDSNRRPLVSSRRVQKPGLALALLADLATLARNTLRIGTADHTFTRLTTPTALQARALELIDVKLHA